MMVAEFGARQQSGSPANGEIPNQNRNAHSGLLLGIPSGPGSPGSPDPDSFQNAYDLADHIKRKELFSQRKQRAFIPDNKKDDSYWDRRRRNNEAAKRSREKRRFHDMVLEQRVVELTKENHVLKAQLDAIKDKYNICGENLVSVDQIMATLPTNEQVLSITKSAKINNSLPQLILYPLSPSPVSQQTMMLKNDLGSPPPPQQQISPQAKQPTIQHTHNQKMYSEIERSDNPCYNRHELMNLNDEENERDFPTNVQETTYHLSNSNNLNQHYYPSHYTMNPVQYPAIHHQHLENSPVIAVDALNLSRRIRSPYELSSGTGSGAASGDDEHERDLIINDANKILPLKLRHKSRLGDKEVASALLALQNIKKEPNIKASPSSWDGGEGSSDERDSGISMGGLIDWPTSVQRKLFVVQHQAAEIGNKDEDNIHLKSQLARLETEVATIKNMMNKNTTGSDVGAN